MAIIKRDNNDDDGSEVRSFGRKVICISVRVRTKAVLIEYWYSRILTYSSSERKERDIDCLVDHLIEFYQENLIKYPLKRNYIKKMLYMLYSLREPFDIETLK